MTYFKDENNKSKRKKKKYKTQTTIMKPFDTVVIFASTSGSFTLSLTGNDLIKIPISAAPAFALSIGNKVKIEIIKNKYSKYKIQYERDPQTIKSFDKIYSKSLQDRVIDEIEYESLCNTFTNYLDEL